MARKPSEGAAPDVRKGQGSTHVDRPAFAARFRERFSDPAFDATQPEIARLTELAWDGYDRYRRRAAHPTCAMPSPTGLTAMHPIEAGAASIDRYVGYYEPYATGHQALDRDQGFQEEVRNAARALVKQVQMTRAGRTEPDAALEEPRKK